MDEHSRTSSLPPKGPPTRNVPYQELPVLGILRLEAPRVQQQLKIGVAFNGKVGQRNHYTINNFDSRLLATTP